MLRAIGGQQRKRMTNETTIPTAAPASLGKRLLAWYDRSRRDLPWRAPPGDVADPYHVWLSEIMLQQTTVATVGPYFGRFVERWPTVHDLASADLDRVLHAWQGLGYYARARNMHACAIRISRDMGGVFPGDEGALRALPGIGPYTAAAIAAIAFDRPASPVDGNIERVMSRLRRIETPLPAAKPEIAEAARRLTPRRRSGDFAQALMDLGATVCTPRRPDCSACPWSDPCLARAAGIQETLPRKPPKAVRPIRHGVVFWATRDDGRVLLRRRPERGLLGGMMEFPSTEWRERRWQTRSAISAAPFAAEWRGLPGAVRHTFTHFHLELQIVTAASREAGTREEVEGLWWPLDRLADQALPTVMKKVARHATTEIA
jgi:A/G-specific adenine glycosylase